MAETSSPSEAKSPEAARLSSKVNAILNPDFSRIPTEKLKPIKLGVEDRKEVKKRFVMTKPGEEKIPVVDFLDKNLAALSPAIPAETRKALIDSGKLREEGGKLVFTDKITPEDKLDFIASAVKQIEINGLVDIASIMDGYNIPTNEGLTCLQALALDYAEASAKSYSTAEEKTTEIKGQRREITKKARGRLLISNSFIPKTPEEELLLSNDRGTIFKVDRSTKATGNDGKSVGFTDVETELAMALRSKNFDQFSKIADRFAEPTNDMVERLRLLVSRRLSDTDMGWTDDYKNELVTKMKMLTPENKTNYKELFDVVLPFKKLQQDLRDPNLAKRQATLKKLYGTFYEWGSVVFGTKGYERLKEVDLRMAVNLQDVLIPPEVRLARIRLEQEIADSKKKTLEMWDKNADKDNPLNQVLYRLSAMDTSNQDRLRQLEKMRQTERKAILLAYGVKYENGDPSVDASSVDESTRILADQIQKRARGILTDSAAGTNRNSAAEMIKSIGVSLSPEQTTILNKYLTIQGEATTESSDKIMAEMKIPNTDTNYVALKAIIMDGRRVARALGNLGKNETDQYGKVEQLRLGGTLLDMGLKGVEYVYRQSGLEEKLVDDKITIIEKTDKTVTVETPDKVPTYRINEAAQGLPEIDLTEAPSTTEPPIQVAEEQIKAKRGPKRERRPQKTPAQREAEKTLQELAAKLSQPPPVDESLANPAMREAVRHSMGTRSVEGMTSEQLAQIELTDYQIVDEIHRIVGQDFTTVDIQTTAQRLRILRQKYDMLHPQPIPNERAVMTPEQAEAERQNFDNLRKRVAVMGVDQMTYNELLAERDRLLDSLPTDEDELAQPPNDERKANIQKLRAVNAAILANRRNELIQTLNQQVGKQTEQAKAREQQRITELRTAAINALQAIDQQGRTYADRAINAVTERLKQNTTFNEKFPSGMDQARQLMDLAVNEPEREDTEFDLPDRNISQVTYGNEREALQYIKEVAIGRRLSSVEDLVNFYTQRLSSRLEDLVEYSNSNIVQLGNSIPLHRTASLAAILRLVDEGKINNEWFSTAPPTQDGQPPAQEEAPQVETPPTGTPLEGMTLAELNAERDRLLGLVPTNEDDLDQPPTPERRAHVQRLREVNARMQEEARNIVFPEPSPEELYARGIPKMGVPASEVNLLHLHPEPNLTFTGSPAEALRNRAETVVSDVAQAVNQTAGRAGATIGHAAAGFATGVTAVQERAGQVMNEVENPQEAAGKISAAASTTRPGQAVSQARDQVDDFMTRVGDRGRGAVEEAGNRVNQVGGNIGRAGAGFAQRVVQATRRTPTVIPQPDQQPPSELSTEAPSETPAEATQPETPSSRRQRLAQTVRNIAGRAADSVVNTLGENIIGDDAFSKPLTEPVAEVQATPPAGTPPAAEAEAQQEAPPTPQEAVGILANVQNQLGNSPLGQRVGRLSDALRQRQGVGIEPEVAEAARGISATLHESAQRPGVEGRLAQTMLNAANLLDRLIPRNQPRPDAIRPPTHEEVAKASQRFKDRLGQTRVGGTVVNAKNQIGQAANTYMREVENPQEAARKLVAAASTTRPVQAVSQARDRVDDFMTGVGDQGRGAVEKTAARVQEATQGIHPPSADQVRQRLEQTQAAQRLGTVRQDADDIMTGIGDRLRGRVSQIQEAAQNVRIPSAQDLANRTRQSVSTAGDRLGETGVGKKAIDARNRLSQALNNLRRQQSSTEIPHSRVESLIPNRISALMEILPEAEPIPIEETFPVFDSTSPTSYDRRLGINFAIRIPLTITDQAQADTLDRAISTQPTDQEVEHTLTIDQLTIGDNIYFGHEQQGTVNIIINRLDLAPGASADIVDQGPIIEDINLSPGSKLRVVHAQGLVTNTEEENIIRVPANAILVIGDKQYGKTNQDIYVYVYRANNRIATLESLSTANIDTYAAITQATENLITNPIFEIETGGNTQTQLVRDYRQLLIGGNRLDLILQNDRRGIFLSCTERWSALNAENNNANQGTINRILPHMRQVFGVGPDADTNAIAQLRLIIDRLVRLNQTPGFAQQYPNINRFVNNFGTLRWIFQGINSQDMPKVDQQLNAFCRSLLILEKNVPYKRAQINDLSRRTGMDLSFLSDLGS